MEKVLHKPLGCMLFKFYGAKPQYPKILVSLSLDQSGTNLQIPGLLGAACFGARTLEQRLLLGVCICQQSALRGRGYHKQPSQHILLPSHADVSGSSVGARFRWNTVQADLVLLRRVHCRGLILEGSNCVIKISILHSHLFKFGELATDSGYLYTNAFGEHMTCA